jgi:aspartyl-tRNA(Asn)/glutamyl-tRNA(Gln) amidotransferase subunit A
MENDLCAMGLLDLELAIAGGRISPSELVDAHLARIAELDPKIGAFVTIIGDRARQEARVLTEELATSGPRGPLHGIPFAAKDLQDSAGVRTSYGSAVFADHVPEEDAEPVRRLRAAGAILLGKTNTHEFACGVTTDNPHFGATHNPWKHGHIPGGSSGGSGAAVAAGLVPFATGTDTGGSIRIPAAACGCVGIKPTWGRVSQRGTFPMDPTMDHVGPIARSARDCAVALNAMAGFDPEDPWSPRVDAEEEFTRLIGRPLRRRRIAIAPGFEPVPVSASVRQNLQKALRAFEELGAEIVEIELPPADEVVETGFTLITAGTALTHRDLLPGNEEKYGPDLRLLIEAAAALDAGSLVVAQRRREALTRRFEQSLILSKCDALVLPTLACEAPPIGAAQVTVEGVDIDVTMAMAAFNVVHDTTRLPSISVPTGLGDAGLPTALQITTMPSADALALGLADALENALWPPAQRKPPL